MLSPGLFSIRWEKALRFAAIRHHGQSRRGSETPYFEHVAGVAMILDRLGCDEDVVIAGLCHDVVEDTDTSLDEIRALFGTRVAELVAACTEVKLDANGQARPWIDRKRDAICSLSNASVDAKCLALADKLHNLTSIQLDLIEGRDIWSSFHADRTSVLNSYRAVIAACAQGDERLKRLSESCLQVLSLIEVVEELAKK